MAFGNSTFSDASAAVSDIFSSIGDQYKAKGAEFERQSYLEAANLAGENEKYTEESQAIKQTQLDREIFKSESATQAAVGGAGLKMSGSALDILGESASQGALTKAVLGRQGLITEEGYKEQQQSYTNMANAAQVAEDAAKTASIGSDISAAINAAASIATFALPA